MSSTLDDSDNGDLRDEALRRALLHAPDHAVTPNWHRRKAILDHAHEAVMPSGALEAPESVRPWWQRLLGLGGGKEGSGRMPWNAAFATVLVGVLVAVLWQREPVPGARPDGEARVHAPAQRSEAPAAPASRPPAEPAPSPAVPPSLTERALPASQDIPGGPAPAPMAETEPAAAAPQGARSAEPASPAARSSGLARRQSEEAALSASAGTAAKEARKKEAAAGQPASPPVAAAPASPVPPPAGPGAARDAAEPSRELRAAAAPPAASGSPEMPSFSALSQWSRLTITQRGGASRSLSRSEAQDVSALLGSAAISAVGTQPLAGPPEWRVTLERSNGDVMATFELGRSQVRWREGRGAAATGTPSPGSVAALREALQRTVEQPVQPASPPQLQLKPTPQQPAESETVPSAAPLR